MDETGSETAASIGFGNKEENIKSLKNGLQNN